MTDAIVLDFGIGNMRSWERLFFRLRTPVEFTKDPERVKSADKLVLPGVGNFAGCMDAFNNSGLRETVEYEVLENKKPILGICVGMQMLAKQSEEGGVDGLGWINGQVKRLPNDVDGQKIRVPHVGNNQLTECRGILFDDIPLGTKFYFTHSYYMDLNDSADSAATCEYGIQFDAAVMSDNIFGCQFHPEKSHAAGHKLVQNFIEKS